MSENREESRERKHALPDDTRQHLQAARDEMRKSVATLFPPGFLEHRRAARREVLKAARSLIDHALRRLDVDEKV